MVMCKSCYWRFKGGHEFRYGWPTVVKGSLIRMGLWNGDLYRGPVVDENEIEVREVL